MQIGFTLTSSPFLCYRYHKLLWRDFHGVYEMGNDWDNLAILRIGISLRAILPNYFAIDARYANHWRHFQDSNGRRLFCKLWRRKQSTSASLGTHIRHKSVSIHIATVLNNCKFFPTQLEMANTVVDRIFFKVSCY